MSNNSEGRAEQLKVLDPATKLKDFLGKVATDPESGFDETSIAFGNALVGYVNEIEVTPSGFITAIALFTGDCVRKEHGYTGEPMPVGLTGYPKIIYNLFEMTAIDMARGAFGDEFANQAQAKYDSVCLSVAQTLSLATHQE